MKFLRISRYNEIEQKLKSMEITFKKWFREKKKFFLLLKFEISLLSFEQIINQRNREWGSQ